MTTRITPRPASRPIGGGSDRHPAASLASSGYQIFGHRRSGRRHFAPPLLQHGETPLRGARMHPLLTQINARPPCPGHNIVGRTLPQHMECFSMRYADAAVGDTKSPGAVAAAFAAVLSDQRSAPDPFPRVHLWSDVRGALHWLSLRIIQAMSRPRPPNRLRKNGRFAGW